MSKSGAIMFLDNMYSEKEAFLLSSEKLAFVGDAVFELLVREKISFKYGTSIGEINKRKVDAVCCEAQAEFFRAIESVLNEREIAVYKRGRNAHIGNVPKKSSPQVYHIATGLEAVFGYLYLSGQLERIRELGKYLNL